MGNSRIRYEKTRVVEQPFTRRIGAEIDRF